MKGILPNKTDISMRVKSQKHGVWKDICLKQGHICGFVRTVLEVVQIRAKEARLVVKLSILLELRNFISSEY